MIWSHLTQTNLQFFLNSSISIWFALKPQSIYNLPHQHSTLSSWCMNIHYHTLSLLNNSGTILAVESWDVFGGGACIWLSNMLDVQQPIRKHVTKWKGSRTKQTSLQAGRATNQWQANVWKWENYSFKENQYGMGRYGKERSLKRLLYIYYCLLRFMNHTYLVYEIPF